MVFETLKRSFTISVHPDPMRPFIVEANSSSSTIGAILSQVSDTSNKLHHCSFYSWALIFVSLFWKASCPLLSLVLLTLNFHRS